MAATPPKPDASMDQVRELLFGEKVRQIEERMQVQEERILQEIRALREDTRQSISSLESTLYAQLEIEGQKRAEGHDDANAQLRDLRAELEHRAELLNEALDSAESSLKKLFTEEHSRISATLEERYRSALDALSANTSQIRHDMVEKTTIAGLLNDLARKIGHQEEQETDS